jgi:vacuolar-type H+-ATPase subunit I/STV1
MAPCEPTVAENERQIAERDSVITRLEAEVERMKRAHADDGSAWRTKTEQLEKDLMVLQKAAERVMEMDVQNWQEGKIMLAHAMLKKKT